MVLKFKKYHKARTTLLPVSRLNNLLYGTYGLKVISPLRLERHQLESVKKIIKKILKKSVVIWQMHYVSVPVSRKPIEVRMGGGKGPIDSHVCLVRAGSILFELSAPNASEKLVLYAMEQASRRLPSKVEIVRRLF